MAREWEVALPNELTLEQSQQLVRAFAQSLTFEGMCVDANIHWKEGNHHAHILGTTRPIESDGQWGKKEKKALRREMGMIFQSAALFDSMTVLDNVMFPLNMFSSDTLRDRTRRAMFCLERVNLIEAKDKFPGEISGGMQKRVAIARAIALNPQYLFCDEPNSGLDPKTSLVIDELIQDITREYNMTTLINTHDMNSVMGIGEKIIYIYEGHKEWEGSKNDIFTSTNERLNNFIFASDLFRKVKEVEIQNIEG